MTYIELMTWLILAVELSAVLLVALVALAVWTWRANSRMAGTVDQIVGQMERAQKVRGSELVSLLGERCPSDALEQAVELCLQRERALLLAVAESLKHRGAMGPERVPSAVQALTAAAVEAGQASVPPEDPNPELMAENEELRSAREELANELAGTREAFETLDEEYRRAFERQQQGTEESSAAAPSPATRPSPPAAPAVPPEPATPEPAVAVAAAEEALAEEALEEDALPPPDVDFDELAADLEALSDGAGPEPEEPEPLSAEGGDSASLEEEAAEAEVIRVDEEADELAEESAPRVASG
jgi:hypothetical protein